MDAKARTNDVTVSVPMRGKSNRRFKDQVESEIFGENNMRVRAMFTVSINERVRERVTTRTFCVAFCIALY